jgi:hypothetical protein
MIRHRLRPLRVVSAVAALTLVASACSGDDDAAAPGGSSASSTAGATSTSTGATTAAPTTTTGADRPVAAAVGPRPVEPFADLREVPELDDADVYAGPATPHSLDDVLLTPSQLQDRALQSPAWRELVEANGFAVTPGFRTFFHQGYDSALYATEPLFVTTDAVYNAWHLVFDRVLRETEEDRLLPVLERLLTGAVAAAREQAAALTGTELAEAADRAAAYYEAAATLAGLDVGPISDRAADAVALAEAAAGVDTSPISGLLPCNPINFQGCVDYSLFRPRGHYTATEDLRRYFGAMSVLGQEAFPLEDGLGVVPGLLVTRVLVGSDDLLADWTALYEPTAFLVGLADDITPLELAAAAEAEAPGWADDPTVLADIDAAVIADAVLDAHPGAIDVERASVRVMGARFTLDAFVLDQLASPNVGAPPDSNELRVNVSGLDIAAAFGSPLARSLQLETEAIYDRYEEQLDLVTEVVAAREPDEWAGTVYDAWLLAIATQFRPNGAAYPDFMQTDAWAARAIQTGLASYAELKHDTVLYAEQGTGVEGEGPEAPDFEPRHWVEPDPVAFHRIAAAADLLRTGMSTRDLLTPESDGLLVTLVELADWLGGIAERELDGQVATDDENERLAGIGGELEYLWIASSEIELDDFGQALPAPDDGAQLVSDVFTASFEYLEVGTGWIDRIHVIVPLGDGRFELATGMVSSYYEFWRPDSAPRLTDEEWRQLVRDGALPPRPAWQASFVADADVATEPIVRMDID